MNVFVWWCGRKGRGPVAVYRRWWAMVEPATPGVLQQSQHARLPYAPGGSCWPSNGAAQYSKHQTQAQKNQATHKSYGSCKIHSACRWLSFLPSACLSVVRRKPEDFLPTPSTNGNFLFAPSCFPSKMTDTILLPWNIFQYSSGFLHGCSWKRDFCSANRSCAVHFA